MTDTLTELKRLHAEATQGPWKVTGELGIEGQADSSTDFDPLVIGGLKGGKGLIQFPSYSLYSQPTRTQGKANAALIVAARNALPKLLACVEALERLLPEAINERYVTQSSAVERARAALASLKGGA